MMLRVYATERKAMEEFQAMVKAMGPNHISKILSKEIWGPGGELTRFVVANTAEHLERLKGLSPKSILCDSAVRPEIQLALLPYVGS